MRHLGFSRKNITRTAVASLLLSPLLLAGCGSTPQKTVSVAKNRPVAVQETPLVNEVTPEHKLVEAKKVWSDTQNKALRILEGFDAVLAARALSVHDNIKHTPFLMEMMEWQPDKNNGRDDGLDAVAGALSCEPARIKRFYTTVQKRWPATSLVHTAQTDFEV